LENSRGALLSESTWSAIGRGAIATLASSALDRSVDRRALRHIDSSASRFLGKSSKAIPLIGFSLAAVLSMYDADSQLSDTAMTAVQGSLFAGALAVGGSYLLGRARPDSGGRASDFDPAGEGWRGGALPSLTTTLAWALAAPFAEEYQAKWLYGLAVATNLGRIAKRHHWVSDTVAGALLGYGVGVALWEWNRPGSRGAMKIGISPGGVTLQVPY